MLLLRVLRKSAIIYAIVHYVSQLSSQDSSYMLRDASLDFLHFKYV